MIPFDNNLRAGVVVWGGADPSLKTAPDEVLAVSRVGLHVLINAEPRFIAIPRSDRPVLQLPVGDELIQAPTGAVLCQLRQVGLLGRDRSPARFRGRRDLHRPKNRRTTTFGRPRPSPRAPQVGLTSGPRIRPTRKSRSPAKSIVREPPPAEDRRVGADRPDPMRIGTGRR